LSAEFVKPKFALAVVSLVIGVSTFMFAVFGWIQTGQALADYSRYICLIGSMGATILGGLLFNEVKIMNRSVVLPIKTSRLDFLAMMELENERIVTIEK
jgi:hypothetical protein